MRIDKFVFMILKLILKTVLCSFFNFLENCNPNFVDSDGANCGKYREKKWCHNGGYGHFWGTYSHNGGTMEDYAVNGETALVCPQCGC